MYVLILKEHPKIREDLRNTFENFLIFSYIFKLLCIIRMTNFPLLLILWEIKLLEVMLRSPNWDSLIFCSLKWDSLICSSLILGSFCTSPFTYIASLEWLDAKLVWLAEKLVRLTGRRPKSFIKSVSPSVLRKATL